MAAPDTLNGCRDSHAWPNLLSKRDVFRRKNQECGRRRKPSIPLDQIEMSGCQKSRITCLHIEQPAQDRKNLCVRF